MKFSKYLSLIDILNFIFWFIIFVFFLTTLSQSEYILEASGLFGGLFAFMLLIIYFRSLKTDCVIYKLLLALYPAVFLILIFESLHMVMPYMIENEYDKALADIDFLILGFHPTVAIEPMINPVMTELMYYLYAFYFPMPFFILIYLFLKKKYIELDKTLFFFLLTYYGSYLMYFAVPALGPRYYEPILRLQQVPLDGLWFSETIRNTINFLEHNKYDAFPSLHAAITLTTLLVIGKYRKKWLYFFIPVATGIFISLVYCRYHYVIDIIAGVAWTMICYWITEKYHKKLAERYFVSFFTR